MHTVRKIQRLLLVVLLAASALAVGPFSATYAKPNADSTLFFPLINAPDHCLEAQPSEPLGETDPNCPPPGGSSGVSRGDFNGDGFADLAIGVAREDLSPSAGTTLEDAGAINVIYGSAGGLTAQNNQFWTQDSPSIQGQAEPFDYFGSSLASGNFNGDAYSDLAIGISGEDVGSVDNAGAVAVLYGSANGLSAAKNQLWNQGSGPSGALLDTPEQSDRFGAALAWGNFNHDNYADLAIGVVYEDVTAGNGVRVADAGAVHVMFGSAAGLQPVGNQLWQQNSPGLGGINEEGDEFGYALTGGDFNGDNFGDLAIGAPGEDLTPNGGSTRKNAGAVTVIYGSGNGLAVNGGPGDQLWSQGSSGIQGVVEAFDYFGMSLAAGDFNNDGRSDLAVGAPYEDVRDLVNAGQVNVIYGAANGLTATGNEIFNQDSSGSDGEVDEVAETGDGFGSALAAGDFDGDGYRDLAIGAPYEDIRDFVGLTYFDNVDAGGVNILVGYGGGLTTDANNFLHASEIFDHENAPCCEISNLHFGQSLSAWNFGHGTQSDLAVGMPGRYHGEGAVGVFYGPLNLDSARNQTWSQDSPDIKDEAENGDQFGRQLY